MTGVGVVAATAAGRRLAQDLAVHLRGEVYRGRPRTAVPAAWGECAALVLVMATGAAVRLLAPLLGDKRRDPGVVCVDEAGRFAVALVGGHEGGANELAARIAAYLHATPVVTTATEAAELPALADLGGLAVEPGSDLATVGGALVSGQPVQLLREQRWPLGPLPGQVVEITALQAGRLPAPLLWVTDRRVDVPHPAVVYRPPSLVVGVGASRGVTVDEVTELVRSALDEAGLSPLSIHCLASVDAKADEEGVVAAGTRLGVPFVTLPAGALAAIPVPNPSAVVAAAVGTPSVAEAAALHLGGELLVPKRRSACATVAVARRPPRGRLALVSLGPGADALVPDLARRALAAAEVVVGYGPYVDQAAAFTRRGVVLERYPLGQEVVRAERARSLAGDGHAVALVSSGDVGVYAMGSPALELQQDRDVEVSVVPGVTAAVAAAALLGSPLGHDHCAISLSDLLTPWEVICARVRAAAEGDFVVSFYNPRSLRRRQQLDDALALLAEYRKPETPVGVVRDAYRPDQHVSVTTLRDLDPATIDMLTILIVGSSQTRVVRGRMVTPRGYGVTPGSPSDGEPPGPLGRLP